MKRNGGLNDTSFLVYFVYCNNRFYNRFNNRKDLEVLE